MGSFKTPPASPGEYDPVAGTGWDPEAARRMWSESMTRSNYHGAKWTLQGLPEQNGGKGFYWRFFDFGPWFGRVTVEADGFHWSTHENYDGTVIHSGVTASIYVAYQSVVHNKDGIEPPLWRSPS